MAVQRVCIVLRAAVVSSAWRMPRAHSRVSQVEDEARIVATELHLQELLPRIEDLESITVSKDEVRHEAWHAGAGAVSRYCTMSWSHASLL